ncbi:unnamed protein product [Rotaria sp. Silwood1]|nr:unnamed protein product [Rotaria sp. Silwood1]CAF3732867.1 unnamed protein product [Rotaria sp. Silwood1]CAF3737284.1 unnamed protein product [Rotaria sp. Silwood1]CAF4681842.1 unnamed protein product [Rotaria sp. Silwood1]CAF4836093.1 unnamed protein product [Rotaria sp. Silwood1]
MTQYETRNLSLLLTTLLTVNAHVEGRSTAANQQVRYRLEYFCSTENCNNGSAFQRILESVTINDQFDVFENILPWNGTYSGRLCLLFSNQTTQYCRNPIPDNPDQCTQCNAQYLYTKNTTKMCATCVTQGYWNPIIEREVLFNITDRTRSETIEIRCGTDNCTTFQTGDDIRAISTIELDLDKFLAPFSGGKQMTISSFHQIIFMIMLWSLNSFFD